MGPRALVVWTAVAAVTAAGAVWSSLESGRQIATASGLDEPVFARLVAAPETAAEITVAHGGDDVTVALENGVWVVRERYGYAADAETVRAVITGLADLRYAAPRTAMAERFERLDVDPPGAGSDAKRLTVRGASGEVLADAIIGKRSQAISQSERGTYLRLPEGERAWLASGTTDAPTDALDWLDTDLPSVDRDELKLLVVTPAEGRGFTVGRLTADDDMTLTDPVPENRAADADQIRRLNGVLAGLRFDDLRPADAVAWPATTTRLEGTGFEDETLVVELAEIDGETWARIGVKTDWIYRLPEFQLNRMMVTFDDLLLPAEAS